MTPSYNFVPLEEFLCYPKEWQSARLIAHIIRAHLRPFVMEHGLPNFDIDLAGYLRISLCSVIDLITERLTWSDIEYRAQIVVDSVDGTYPSPSYLLADYKRDLIHTALYIAEVCGDIFRVDYIPHHSTRRFYEGDGLLASQLRSITKRDVTFRKVKSSEWPSPARQILFFSCREEFRRDFGDRGGPPSGGAPSLVLGH